MKIEQGRLQGALKAALLHVGNDLARGNYSGVLLEFRDGEIGLVATNGHTLTHITLPCNSGRSDSTCLLPVTCVKLWVEALKCTKQNWHTECTVTPGKTTVTLDSAGRKLESEALDLHFPDWRQVVPELTKAPATSRIGLDMKYLELAAKTAKAFFAGVKSNPLELQVGKDDRTPVRIDTHHPDVGHLTTVIMPMRLK
jgi:DNA polymerase III sliding clamp (beta) subunit (PCNA family)